jgi:hypothetical protein
MPIMPDVVSPSALNRLGEQGWELVCYIPGPPPHGFPSGAMGYVLFKREKLESEPYERANLPERTWLRVVEGKLVDDEEQQ